MHYASKITEDIPGISVWVIEDQDLFRRTLEGVINDTEGMSCPVAVETCEEALTVLESGTVPDIVLMDIGLPGMNGIDGTRRIKALTPSTRVLMLTDPRRGR